MGQASRRTSERRRRETTRAAKRRAQSVSRRRSTIRRAFFRWTVLIATVIAALAIAGLVFTLAVSTNSPERVTGELSNIRDVSFTTAPTAIRGISPVCGCKRPPVNAWRGITFAAREVTLTRRGHSPWTQWDLSGAAPEEIGFVDNVDWLTMRAVRFQTRAAFNPLWMLGSLKRHGRVRASSVIQGYDSILLTHGSIHVAMLGPAPVAAWIPYPGAHVSITRRPSAFPQQAQASEISEEYPAAMGVHKNRLPSPQSYPLGDFLAPNVVVWTEDAAAHLSQGSFEADAGPHVVTALLLPASSFALRVAAIPLANSEAKLFTKGLLSQHRSRREPRGVVGAFDGGGVTVDVSQPMSRRAYSEMREHVAAQETRWLDLRANPDIEQPNGAPVPPPEENGEPPAPWRYRRQERYPPLPLYDGFNIFGPLSSLTFEAVNGNLNVQDRTVNLSGSPELTLSDLKRFRDIDGGTGLAAPLATSEGAAKLAFRAVAGVRVNGVTQTTWWRAHSDTAAIVLGILSLLSTVIAVLSFLQGLRRDPQPR